jgi:hypothetical protein
VDQQQQRVVGVAEALGTELDAVDSNQCAATGAPVSSPVRASEVITSENIG